MAIIFVTESSQPQAQCKFMSFNSWLSYDKYPFNVTVSPTTASISKPELATGFLAILGIEYSNV